MNKVDLSSSEVIQPSSIFHHDETSSRVTPTLQYLPSSKYFVFLTNPQLVNFTNADTNSGARHYKYIHLDDQLKSSNFSLHPKNNVLALGISSVYFDFDHRQPAHVQLVKISQNLCESEDQVIPFQSTLFINPHFQNCRITKMKFFPDGSRLIVTYSNGKNGSWCKIFTLPESWDNSNSSNEWSAERWSVPANSKTASCDEIDVFEQGFPTVDENEEKLNYEDLSEEEYFRIYNERYYSSNLDGGFFCLAISPDTTRLLAGSHDGEIYVIDSTTLKVLHCKREYGYCKTVTGCHYSPVFGNEEFAVCNEIGIFDIWNIATLDDGSEEASKVHHLHFPPGTSNCVYSPDGKLIALTSGANSKTYVISSTSGNILFTLSYQVQDVVQSHDTFYRASSLFFGDSCRVATVHDDNIICLWNLPVVYRLKTLCLLMLKALVIYNDIEQLCLPSSLKKLLKYQYV